LSATINTGKWFGIVVSDSGVRLNIGGRQAAGRDVADALGKHLPGYSPAMLASAGAVLLELMKPRERPPRTD
jgi:hypothetical protein